MDRKTLEDMEVRVVKAKEIIKEVDSLKKNIESISRIQIVRFINENWSTQFDSSSSYLTDSIKEAYVKVATEKMERLEKELAEL